MSNQRDEIKEYSLQELYKHTIKLLEHNLKYMVAESKKEGTLEPLTKELKALFYDVGFRMDREYANLYSVNTDELWKLEHTPFEIIKDLHTIVNDDDLSFIEHYFEYERVLVIIEILKKNYLKIFNEEPKIVLNKYQRALNHMYSKVDKTLDARTEYGLLSSIISKERAQMMYVDKEMNYVCLNCKEIIHSESDRYCSYCGQKLKKEDTMSFRTYHWATSSDDNKKALTIQKDMVAFLLSLDIEVRFLKVTVSEDPNFDQVSNDEEDRDESLDATYSSEGEFVLGYKDVYTFEKAYEEFFKVINPRYPDFITLMLSVKDEGDDDTSI